MSGGRDGRAEIRTALAESRRLFASIGLFSAFVDVLMLTGPLFQSDAVCGNRCMAASKV